jgi:hypothetical protein
VSYTVELARLSAIHLSLCVVHRNDECFGILGGFIHSGRFRESADKCLKTSAFYWWTVLARSHGERGSASRARYPWQVVPRTVIQNQIAFPKIKRTSRTLPLDAKVSAIDIAACHPDTVAKLPSLYLSLLTEVDRRGIPVKLREQERRSACCFSSDTSAWRIDPYLIRESDPSYLLSLALIERGSSIGSVRHRL